MTRENAKTPKVNLVLVNGFLKIEIGKTSKIIRIESI
jgi:hypothetical protein